MILPHLDYCNALFHGLPDYLLCKLTEVLYAALCFIYTVVLNFLSVVVCYCS